MKDGIEEAPPAIRLRVSSQLPSHRGGDCHSNRAGHALGMRMGDERRSSRFFDAPFPIIGEICAERSDPHGAPVSHRALSSESIRGRVTPLRAGRDLAHLDASHLAVAAVWIALEASRESFGQSILINETV